MVNVSRTLSIGEYGFRCMVAEAKAGTPSNLNILTLSTHDSITRVSFKILAGAISLVLK